MTLSEQWLLCAEWFVVWLVVLPMILYRAEHLWMSDSGMYDTVTVGFCSDLYVSQANRTFFFLCHFRK